MRLIFILFVFYSINGFCSTSTSYFEQLKFIHSKLSINPWYLDDDKDLKIENLVKLFGEKEKLVKYMSQVSHLCEVQQNEACFFEDSNSPTLVLYFNRVTADSSIFIFSFSSPKRTEIYLSKNGLQMTKLYDSFLTNNKCQFPDKTPLGFIGSVNSVGGFFIIKDQIADGKSARKLNLILDMSQCKFDSAVSGK